MKTFSAKSHEVKRNWFVVDAKGQPIGRLASRVASILKGKHKPIYTPHVDTGDAVIIINAEQVAATGSKEDTKIYYRHSGFQSGLRAESLRTLRKEDPRRVLEVAIKGMLPKGPLGREMFSKLKVYVGAEHPHTAQQPQVLELV